MITLSKRFYSRLNLNKKKHQEKTVMIKGYLLNLQKTPTFSNFEDIKRFLSENNCPVPKNILKSFSESVDKKVGWVLEFEDEKLNEKAYQILHTKKFGQHKVKAYKVTSDLIIPGVSDNTSCTVFLSNLPYSISNYYLLKFIHAKAPKLNVKAINMIYDQENKSSKKAYITFESEEEASLATILLHQENIRSTKINVFPLS